MRCFVGLLLLGLCLSVDAHNIPRFRDESYTHTPFKDWHEHVRARWPEDHWHYSERQAGAWDQCVAGAYDEAQDSYKLVRGNCVDDDGRMIDSGADAPTTQPEIPRDDWYNRSWNSYNN